MINLSTRVQFRPLFGVRVPDTRTDKDKFSLADTPLELQFDPESRRGGGGYAAVQIEDKLVLGFIRNRGNGKYDLLTDDELQEELKVGPDPGWFSQTFEFQQYPTWPDR